MKYGRWFLLFLCILLFTACRVTVNVETEENADAVPEDTPEAAPPLTSEAPAEDPEDTGGQSEVQTDDSIGDDTDSSPADSDTSGNAPEETKDKAHTPIPDFDPTPLPGYESIVFVGDSRTLTMALGGTYEFNLVPDDSVEATWGGVLTDESAFQNARLAARKHREKAVFWYGINDS